jgi:hypothetical protein
MFHRSEQNDDYRIEYHHRPGRTWDDTTLAANVRGFRRVAATCFDQLPEYQCIRGDRQELCDHVITIARDAEGHVRGFSSAVILPIPGVGDLLHLGLTCVDPDARGASLSHRLNSMLVTRHLIRRALLGRVWVSNVACVLSSLGNVALHFDRVFPSPFVEVPSREHLVIARAFDRHHRPRAFVREDAVFDEESFVFRGSGRGTPFQKEGGDARYHHRDEELNQFYSRLLHFEDGDEILQIGHCDALSALRYAGRMRARRRRSGQRHAEPAPGP